ncbi:metallophosphoesterase [uncultured Muribaculum sp.]|uniref:metallophosphoesterase n=1 Tax=uncultured Muribaculum sp. TaxID=1918613 RepID=UPI002677232A|nr:metallophosphoesterase [uncultured Muribaculum sp.]
MRLPLLLISLIVIFNIAIDLYIWHTIKRTCRHCKSISRIYAISSIILTIFIITAIALPRKSGSDTVLVSVMWMIYSYFSIYIPKLLYCIILWMSIPFQKYVTKQKANLIGIIVAFLTFTIMWWGAAINRLNIKVANIDVISSTVPEAFDGYRILQFSDFHVGTYGSDTSYVHKVVECINDLKPDLVVFTGDIVNRRTTELMPFISILSKIKAQDGVISILGNHDYGDYCSWPDNNAKDKNLLKMDSLQRAMGWMLLRNQSSAITRGTDSIKVIGVENWGEPPFKKYGDLQKAYPHPDDSNFKILLTHNPEHWRREIAPNDSMKIALTMSGHTHAMQIQAGHWSPSAWRYSTWGGLYKTKNNNDKQLYVNIGLGTVGVPARIGATPELTLLTLRKQK